MLSRTLVTVTIFATTILGTGCWSRSATGFAACVDDFTEAQVSYDVLASECDNVAQRGDEVREEFHQTYPLAADGRVSVENLNGSVRITISDRNEVQVNAVKRAYKQERLTEARIEVSSTADAIRIKTRYPNEDQSFTDDERAHYNNPAIVEYSIVVPRKARLESLDVVNGSIEIDGVEGDVKASSVNGRVIVHGLMGEAKLNTVNGNVEATFAQLTEAKPLSLGSVNGSVDVVIPSDSNAVVRAETINGSIRNDFGLAVQDGEYVGHSLYGQLGLGGPKIKLSNVNGSINIKHAQDGRSVSAASSLLSQKDKEKNKNKNDSDTELGNITEEARQLAEQVRREVEPEAQREAQRALREAQREIRQAQREVQRETQRQVREQVRVESRGEARASGMARGRGEGTTKERFIDKETKSFPVAGTANVNIGTFDGSITVHGWDKPEVMYAATKRGADEQEVKAVHIETEQEGSSISVIAKSVQGDGSANLDVYVPRNANLHVSSGDGRLSLQGVAGELTLRTGDGNIDVADSGGQLKVNTGDGHIRISNFDGQTDARTGDGAIILDGRFTNLTARTGGGSISLSVAPDSNFTIESEAEEINNEGLAVSEDIAPSKRAKRWKVGRGGNVFVLSAGDGKIVLKPR
ncbi:MAG: DUF4097 family beta strand repeat-containing protein [Acidobacteriota bacterium]|nr:DUF4097 family beta strand repeat-containing protein [Acidobacteriota bacterium]